MTTKGDTISDKCHIIKKYAYILQMRLPYPVKIAWSFLITVNVSLIGYEVDNYLKLLD